MHLTAEEIEGLRATIGKPAFRLFCSSPSIFFGHIEASSFSIWLDSRPDFVNLFSKELDTFRFRMVIERSETPRHFRFEAGAVSGCADIFKKTQEPSTIRQINVYERYGIDSALIFEYLEEGDRFGLLAGDALDEVCFFWDIENSRIEETHTLRTIIR